jgi:GNAT superfamily N-acetyltransferase
MMPVLKHLWQLSFGDGEAYTGFLFHQLQPERMLVWMERSTVAAMLCWQPVDLAAPGGTLKAAYMFGFNTHPQFRGQGVGTALLEGFHRYIFGKGYEAACLAPADGGLFGYYGKRGYETLFHIRQTEIQAGELAPPEEPCVLVQRAFASLLTTRGRYFGDSLYGRWPSSVLHLIGEECRHRYGAVLRVAYGGGHGYAVAVPLGEGRLLVNELAVPPRAAPGALYAMQQRFAARSLTIRTRTDYPLPFAAQDLPFVMVRWYDRSKQAALLAGLKHPPYFAHILD